jgi:hypothetical protein
MVVGVFRDRVNANQAYHWLLSRGYRDSEINFMMSDETRKAYESETGKHTVGSQATEGVATGGTIGATIGATAAAIAAIGTAVAIPGLGWVVAGPVLAGLAGAGAGAVTGGLIGGLIGLGVPESNARAYEEALKNGGVVLGVEPRDGDASEIKRQFESFHGENVICCS